MLKNRWLIIGSTLVLIALIAGLYLGKRSSENMHSPFPNPMPINASIGIMPMQGAALLFIAKENGFFKEFGFKVSLVEYPTGANCLDALLSGEVDMAYATEFPLVKLALNNKEFKILTTINRFNHIHLFGSKSRTIFSIQDLKGKRIGLVKRTIVDFYLSDFLLVNGLMLEDVKLVDLKVSELGDAISNNRADAVAAWFPPSIHVREQLAEDAVAWPIQDNMAGFGNLTCLSEWTETNPESLTQFMRALSRARDYLHQYPDSAKSIIQQYTNLNPVQVEEAWQNTEYDLTLDESLILVMEHEARWLADAGMPNQEPTPNFLEYIYLDALKAVLPEAVTIIE